MRTVVGDSGHLRRPHRGEAAPDDQMGTETSSGNPPYSIPPYSAGGMDWWLAALGRWSGPWRRPRGGWFSFKVFEYRGKE